MLIIESIYFMLPAYLANMAPVIVKKIKFLNKPIDFGLKIKGREILGSHKTWRGLFFGVLFGIIMAYIQFLLSAKIGIIDYTYWLPIGALMGFGAIFGDMVESFIKRLIKIKPGAKFVPWDQLDFVLGSLACSYFLIPENLRFEVILIIIIISPLLHIIINHLSFYLGFRNEKW